jgi:acyl-CoA synthetase (AMP-forming)/AMP-acid ligase II
MIFRSRLPDTAIDDRTVHEFVLEQADRQPDHTAIIDSATGASVTYAGLRSAVTAVAVGFAERGLKKGDVVGIDAPNSIEWVTAFLGIAMAGGVVTTVSPLFTSGELGAQLAASRARFLVTVPALMEKARAAATASAIEEIFVFGDAAGATPFETLASAGPAPDVQIDPARDLVVLPFSSGTTGMPKGVMLTHRNLVANIGQTNAVERVASGDTALGVLPFFHIYGMVCIMGLALHAGGTIVTMPRFDLEAFLDAIQTYHVTCVNLVPPIIIALAKHPLVDRYDLSSVRNITSGAAPLGADIQAACSSRLGCTVRQGYGLTETSPVTHLTPHPPEPQKAGSVGPPIPNTEVMIADMMSGESLPPGAEGEVWIRGPQVMHGYFDNPEATEAMITSDGWLRTGDIGRADEDGYLYIVDRAKELIKYNAYQVAPAELEAVLLSHSGIADAAVVGMPDEEAGEVPAAFVVRSADISEQDIIDFVASRVAPYKKIRAVVFRDAIPKSPSGKILRRELRAEARTSTGT